MKSAVFIDVGYVIKVSKIKQIRLDFKKLSDELTNGTEHVKTLFYDTVPPDTDARGRALRRRTQIFHTQLRRHKNFEVKLGRLQKIGNKFQQKGVDITLAVDLVQMSMKKEIDKAIVITADSDFKYAVQQAKKEGVIVSLSCFPISKIHGPFRQSFTNEILLDDVLINKCKESPI